VDAELDAWDRFAAGHPFGTVYHLSDWKRVIESAFPHIRGGFVVLRDAGAIRAGLAIYQVKSWLLGNRLVSIPFANFSDPLVATPEEFDLLVDSLSPLAERIAARFTEIRTRLALPSISAGRFAVLDLYRHHFIPLDAPADQLLARFSKTNIQNRISKAAREDVRVSWATEASDMAAFYGLFTETRRRLALPPIPYAFFAAIWTNLWPAHADLALAHHAGEICGGLLLLKANNQVTVEYSGDRPDGRARGVNQLLYWEGIKRAQAQGYKTFSLGRTAISNEGLLAYKRRWGGQEAGLPMLFHPKGLRDPDAAVERKRSYKLMQMACRRAPGPCYSWLGGFLYRHWG
jgi:CelD/BcsL family acetyltransferase involved in cellulose biosynthesis